MIFRNPRNPRSSIGLLPTTVIKSLGLRPAPARVTAPLRSSTSAVKAASPAMAIVPEVVASVPVTMTQPEEPGLPTPVIVGAVAVGVLAIAAVAYKLTHKKR